MYIVHGPFEGRGSPLFQSSKRALGRRAYWPESVGRGVESRAGREQWAATHHFRGGSPSPPDVDDDDEEIGYRPAGFLSLCFESCKKRRSLPPKGRGRGRCMAGTYGCAPGSAGCHLCACHAETTAGLGGTPASLFSQLRDRRVYVYNVPNPGGDSAKTQRNTSTARRRMQETI